MADETAQATAPEQLRAKLLEDIRALVTSATMSHDPERCTPSEFRVDVRLSLANSASITIGLGFNLYRAEEIYEALGAWFMEHRDEHAKMSAAQKGGGT